MLLCAGAPTVLAVAGAGVCSGLCGTCSLVLWLGDAKGSGGARAGKAGGITATWGLGGGVRL